VTFACQPEMLPRHIVTLVKPLVAAGLLREKERMILAPCDKAGREPASDNKPQQPVLSDD
jgi:hypothetical protein